MIVNGASRKSVAFWSRHLGDDVKNDRATLIEIRGLAAENLRDGLLEMEEDARHTRCQNFFYQANFNPAPGEILTEQQWEQTFQIFEKHRGIPEGQARIVYEHEKEGRIHRHVIWSRIDLEKLKAWPDGLDAKICHAASREISEELGLQRSISPFDKDREGPRPERAPEPWEMFRGLRSGMDPRDIRAEVTAIYRESVNAADFVAGLEQHGYQLVRGDRRQYCILDSAGEEHSLARRLEGVNAKQLLGFMYGLQMDVIPTIAQAKAHWQSKQLEEHVADLETVQQEILWEEALARSAVQREKREPQFKEPTQRQIEERDRREKIWPSSPPISEPIKTSPQYHFDDANRQVTNPQRVQQMPENLRGYAAVIWEAYNHRSWDRKEDRKEIKLQQRDPEAFKQALEEKNILLASVTKDEAARSHMDSEFAHAVKGFAPSYKEGEIVAVTEQGYVFKLGRRSTGKEPWQVQQFLAPLDKKELKGIAATKEVAVARSEQNIREVQAFRDLLRDAKQAERLAKAEKAPPGRKGDLRRKALDPVADVIVSGLKGSRAVLGVADVLLDGIAGIFAPTLSPVQKAEARLGRAERDANERDHQEQRSRDRNLDREI